MTFADIATPLIERGIPITPVRPGSKRAFLPDFPTTASTDPAQISEWNRLYSDHNAACVARAEDGGVWFWEVDSPDVWTRLMKDTGHDGMTELQTFKVRSRQGRGHLYFLHNERSKALGNISQTYVLGQDWSVRTHREYVVAPGSIHPDTGMPYEVRNNAPITEAPDWLIDWFLTQKIGKIAPSGQSAPDAPRNERGLVPRGAIHGYMLSQAGRLRQMGLEQDAIEVALLQLVHANCEPPIDESKVSAMAKSICNYPAGVSTPIALTMPTPATATPVEPPKLHTVAYPKFPSWVMEGTSIYEGFVKPYCAVNSRVPYFMWMPTAALMMNYLGTKVHVPLKGWKPSFYIILVGTRGKANKSSSIKDGMAFLEFAGVLDMYSKEVKNADGKSIVFEAGSPEGLGTDMQRINCKNAVLFYDELSGLVSKNSIQGSSMPGTLLKLYDSNSFSNSIKAKKDTYAVKPDSYVASLVTSATTKNFAKLWGSLIRDSDGLDNRTTIVLQPETLPETTPQQVVPFQEAALATRKLIDRAVNQGKFQFFDQSPYVAFLQKYPDNRVQVRAEKWALYFAIDLGLTEIDEDCVERGIALAEYEVDVKKYLSTMESRSELAGLQQDIVRKLQYAGGKMPIYGRRSLRSAVNADSYDSWIWKRALDGLLVLGQIAVDTPSSPQVATLLRGFDSDEADVEEGEHAA
jgi:Bifunctional DNA primase/polymerase, N-terminal